MTLIPGFHRLPPPFPLRSKDGGRRWRSCTSNLTVGFLFNISLRPSCYACPAKSGKSGSDITLGDFWGVEQVLPEFDDDKGVSVVLCFTEKGKQLLESVLPYERLSVAYATAIACNPSMLVSVNRPKCRGFFLHRLLKQGCSFDRALDDALEMRPLKRARRLLFYWLGY